MSDWGFETRQVHAGAEPDPTTGARAVPIYQTTSFVFRDTEHAAALFGLAELGNIYTRIMNPTQAVFEERIAALEGGVGALATASGQAAETIALLNLGRERRPHRGFGIALRRHLQPAALHVPEARRGGQLHRRPRRPRRVEGNAIRPEHAGVLRREHRQPEGRHPRLRGRLGDRARREGIPFVIDNTLATPYLLPAVATGAPTSSCTRRRSSSAATARRSAGSSSTAASSTTSPAVASPTSPSPTRATTASCSRSCPEPLRPAQYILKARLQYQRDIGAAISPFNSFLFLQGLETLSLRMERHSQNALAVAEWLEARDEVEWVAYPGLESSQWNDRAKKYLPTGPGRDPRVRHQGWPRGRPALHRRPRAVQPPRQRRRRAQPRDPPRDDDAPAARPRPSSRRPA